MIKIFEEYKTLNGGGTISKKERKIYRERTLSIWDRIFLYFYRVNYVTIYFH